MWFALGIGLLLMAPILYVYGLGDGSEDTLINSIASIMMVPGMILTMPVLLLAPFFSDPDRYVLGAFFYTMPFVSFALYSFCTYGVLSLIARKK